MEWFAEARVTLREADLQRYLGIDDLPGWCAAIERVLTCNGDRGRLSCVFGEHTVHREMIRGGVRFSLPSCEYALQWTVTAEATRPGVVRVHCSSNRREHDAAWIATLQGFLTAWQAGLEGWPARARLQRAGQAGVECEPSFSGFG